MAKSKGKDKAKAKLDKPTIIRSKLLFININLLIIVGLIIKGISPMKLLL
jgi:hypothetical protein